MTDETADLSLAPVSDLGRSLFASVEYTRARACTHIRARAHTHTRVHATEAAGAFSLSLLQTHVHPSRTTPLGHVGPWNRRRPASFKLSD